MTRIVVLSATGVGAAELSSLPADAEVTVVGRSGAVDGARLVALPPARGFLARLDALALRTAPGRAVRRLTWLDPGVVFWRASLRTPGARAALEAADLVVATDRDTRYAAWRWARARRRSGRPLVAVSGMLAARGHLAAK